MRVHDFGQPAGTEKAPAARSKTAVAGCGDDLRHTHERRRAGAGLGLPIIGKLLGHAQASTTARARCRHGRHLRGWTYYFASRRRLSNPLVCSRVSFRPTDSLGINGVNSGPIWQPPTNQDALMRPFTATRSRAWLRIC
jgi:hypothetical protein